MKKFFILLLLIQACKQTPNTATAIHKSNPMEKVGLDFINGYVKNVSYSNSEEFILWGNRQTNVTDDFKKALAKLIRDGEVTNPGYGLGFDPIVDGQDAPDKGFELENIDSTNNVLLVKGIDWPTFKVAMILKKVNNLWLVDGCGVVNIPEKFQAPRY